MPAAPTIGDYAQAATQKFNALTPQLSALGFWKLGNSLDTMIDYLARIDGNGADTVGNNVITICNNLLDEMGPDWPWTWFDDYGWWVISTTRAAQQPFFSPGVTSQFAELSTECWSRFTENAPDVWERRKSGTFGQCGPFVPGGVWNAYWKGTSSDYPGDKEGDPVAGTLAGIQNTVTNCVYMISAQRRGDAVAAKGEFEFLQSWLFSQKSGLWWPQKGNGALVRERVSRYANVDPAPGFQEDWAWAGDLGLLLGIFVDRLGAGVDVAADLGYVKALLTGAQGSLADDKDVLQPWTASGHPPLSPNGKPDKADYLTGTGVFWRYFLQAWMLGNPDLNNFLRSQFTNFVQTNAKAALADTTDPDTLSNQIAALVAAAVMLG